MQLKIQKRLAAEILKCSPSRVKFIQDNLKEIKEAITRADIRGLIIDGSVYKEQKVGKSNFHSNLIKTQKRKGRQKNHGSRKGVSTARFPSKADWINKIRKQRLFIKTLLSHNLIDKVLFHELYLKSKGGFFRSKRHIQLYMTEHGMFKQNK